MRVRSVAGSAVSAPGRGPELGDVGLAGEARVVHVEAAVLREAGMEGQAQQPLLLRHLRSHPVADVEERRGHQHAGPDQADPARPLGHEQARAVARGLEIGRFLERVADDELGAQGRTARHGVGRAGGGGRARGSGGSARTRVAAALAGGREERPPEGEGAPSVVPAEGHACEYRQSPGRVGNGIPAGASWAEEAAMVVASPGRGVADETTRKASPASCRAGSWACG